MRFKESKLLLNQSLKVRKTVLLVLQNSTGFEWDTKMLVSSANRIGIDFTFTNLGKSFTNTRKSKGPRTDPCGTPCSTLDQADVMILP